MRLQQQLAIIKRAIPILRAIKWQQVPNSNTAASKPAVASVLTELSTLPYFREYSVPMQMFHTFAVGGNDIVLDATSYNQWSGHHGHLLAGLAMMEEALKLAVPQADATTISIRLPGTTSLTRLSEIASELEKILLPVIDAKDDTTQVSVRGFDTGSMWVVIFLGSVFGLGIVNNLCQAASRILALRLEFKRSQLTLKQMVIEDTMLGALELRAQKHQQDEMRALATAIEKETFPNQDNERVGRIEHSIELLAKLNELGGEIRPAIEPVTPAKKGEGFPDIRGMLEASKKELSAAAAENLLGPADDEKKT
jgi:hypothetical protein